MTLHASANGAEWRLAEETEVEPVWAAHPVGFCLLTQGERQFVAYYDAERRLRVAQRMLGEKSWRFATLPEQVGWDSHNSVTLAVDRDGALHLSGNMHCVPLKYFRTREPLEAATFERAPMVGERESRATYPKFFRGAKEELIFTYRDGGSGRGDQLYNGYDLKTRTWKRLIDGPLTWGEGKMNAYLHGPVKGPDGLFHLCRVWRDTPDCATNHDPCYARSADLLHWETGAGGALKLPITLGNADVVDPVPAGGGAINGNVRLGFDSKQRPLVSYHKFDERGKTQVYNARLEGGKWKVYRTSEWDYRWEFGGGGSIDFEISVSGVTPAGPGRLRQSYRHPKQGSGAWLLDEETLKIVGAAEKTERYPAALGKVRGDFPGLEVRRASDLGGAPEPDVKYLLQWETLGRNRDRPRPKPWPAPSMLRVLKLERAK